MRDIDKAFLEQMENEKFNKIITDDLSFADSLIDKGDIDRIFEKEDTNNGNND